MGPSPKPETGIASMRRSCLRRDARACTTFVLQAWRFTCSRTVVMGPSGNRGRSRWEPDQQPAPADVARRSCKPLVGARIGFDYRLRLSVPRDRARCDGTANSAATAALRRSTRRHRADHSPLAQRSARPFHMRRVLGSNPRGATGGRVIAGDAGDRSGGRGLAAPGTRP